MESHPARGAWIETLVSIIGMGIAARRTPRGVRGLKRLCLMTCFTFDLSHPARGAWIETVLQVGVYSQERSRTPRGVRGLKLPMIKPQSIGGYRRTPRGVRGLKHDSRNQ